MVAGGACRPSGSRSRHHQCHRNGQVRSESAARFQDRPRLWQDRGRGFSVSGERTTSDDESRRLASPPHSNEYHVAPPTSFGRPLVPVANIPSSTCALNWRFWISSLGISITGISKPRTIRSPTFAEIWVSLASYCPQNTMPEQSGREQPPDISWINSRCFSRPNLLRRLW